MSTGAATGASAAAAAVIQAVRASGAIVRVEAGEFLAIVQRQQDPLVVHALTGFFSTKYQYLTSYKGLAFFAKSDVPINLPEKIQLVQAQKMWMPA